MTVLPRWGGCSSIEPSPLRLELSQSQSQRGESMPITSEGNGPLNQSASPWQMGELSQSQAAESLARGSQQSPPVEVDDSELQPAPVSQSLLSDSAQDDAVATVQEVETKTYMNTSTRALLAASAGVNVAGQDSRTTTSVADASIAASSVVSHDPESTKLAVLVLVLVLVFLGGVRG